METSTAGIDMTTTSGFLELVFTEMGFVLVGLAAATLVAVRSSDEIAGRLELQLATPLSRARWAVASTAAVFAAMVVMTLALGAAIAAGVAAVGDEPLQPAVGSAVLALYGMALAGIGAAVAGVFGASFAAPTVLAVAIATFLVDLLAPALHLPDWVEQLALTAHLGRPMVGSWDAAGTVVYLQQAAAVLPDRPELRAVLDQLGGRIRSSGGEASLLETVSPTPAWEAELVARFDAARDAEYEEVIDSVERFEDEIRRETRKKRFRFAELEESETDWEKLQRWFTRLTVRDFFGAPGRAAAEQALARGRAQLDDFTRAVYRQEGLDVDAGGGRARR